MEITRDFEYKNSNRRYMSYWTKQSDLLVASDKDKKDLLDSFFKVHPNIVWLREKSDKSRSYPVTQKNNIFLLWPVRIENHYAIVVESIFERPDVIDAEYPELKQIRDGQYRFFGNKVN